jgi:hypothetical protein
MDSFVNDIGDIAELISNQVQKDFISFKNNNGIARQDEEVDETTMVSTSSASKINHFILNIL